MSTTIKKVIHLHITKADLLVNLYGGAEKGTPISEALEQASLANTKLHINFDGDIEIEIDTTHKVSNPLNETLTEMEEQDLANEAASDAE